MDPTVIRASALSGYFDCRRRAATRILGREIAEAGHVLARPMGGIGAAVGTAVHAATASAFREKAATGAPGQLSAATDVGVQELRERTAEGVLFDLASPDSRTAERQTVRMIHSAVTHLVPTIRPLLIEAPLEATTPFGLVISGHPDIVAFGEDAIHDLKTGRVQRAHGPQVGSYSLLARSHGHKIARAVIDFVERASLRKEQPPPVSEAYEIAEVEQQAMNVLGEIARDIAVWRNGDAARRIDPWDPRAFSANPSSMLCSAKYCPAWGTTFCTEHRRPNK